MTKAELLAALDPYENSTEIVCPDLEPIVDVEYVPAHHEQPAFVILCDCAADDTEGGEID